MKENGEIKKLIRIFGLVDLWKEKLVGLRTYQNVSLQIRVCLDIAYYWKLKTKNWKHCNKIIFKCVNSSVGPNFKVDFSRFCTCDSPEQCMRPIKMKRRHTTPGKNRYPNSHLVCIWVRMKNENYFTI